MEQISEMAETGTGKGVRVAVLDTGVDADHPALGGCVCESREAPDERRGLSCPEALGGDPVGHGTACAGIIHEWAPCVIMDEFLQRCCYRALLQRPQHKLLEGWDRLQ